MSVPSMTPGSPLWPLSLSILRSYANLNISEAASSPMSQSVSLRPPWRQPQLGYSSVTALQASPEHSTCFLNRKWGGDTADVTGWLWVSPEMTQAGCRHTLRQVSCRCGSKRPPPWAGIPSLTLGLRGLPLSVAPPRWHTHPLTTSEHHLLLLLWSPCGHVEVISAPPAPPPPKPWAPHPTHLSSFAAAGRCLFQKARRGPGSLGCRTGSCCRGFLRKQRAKWSDPKEQQRKDERPPQTRAWQGNSKLTGNNHRDDRWGPG